jgi:hypothetical protein
LGENQIINDGNSQRRRKKTENPDNRPSDAGFDLVVFQRLRIEPVSDFIHKRLLSRNVTPAKLIYFIGFTK